MVSGFWVSLCVVALAFVLSFFLRATPLRQKSALEEVADADAAILAQEAAEFAGAMVGPDVSERPTDDADESGQKAHAGA
jgi:hypothetical protein